MQRYSPTTAPAQPAAAAPGPTDATFRELAEKSLVGVYLVQDDLFRYVNPRLAEMFGYSVAELTDKLGPRQLTHPEDWPISQENFRKRLAGEVPSVQYTLRAIKKDGRVIVIEVYGARTLHQNRPAIIGTLIDITARVRAEEELRRSEREFRRIIDNLIDTFYRTNLSGEIVLASRAAEELLGWSPEALIGQRLADFYVDPEGRQKFLEKLQQSGGRVIGYEAVLRRQDGSHVWVETNAHYYRDDAGQICGVEGTVRDITTRRATERALRESEERFRRLQELSSTGMGLHENGVIIEPNIALARLTGYDQAELVGMDGLLLIAPEYRELAREKIRTGYDKPYRARGLRKDGSTYPLEITGRNMPYQGRMLRVTELQDLSERAQAEHEREQLQRQLQQAQKMEAIGQLTGGIAHDFNNIMTAILGYAKLAQKFHVTEPDGQLAEFLAQIIRAGERAANLVSQMLAFSRGGAIVDCKPLALAAVVDEVLRMLRPTLPSTIVIERALDGDVPLVHADPVQLHQVLTNLFINARDAMGERGLLRVSVRRADAEKRHCTSCHGEIAGDYIAVGVADSGSGMSAATINQIFQPFFTTKDVGKGSGMGLSVVHGIVHRLGGHILVDSTPGIGSTFWILLPAIAAELTAATANLTREPNHGQVPLPGTRILVVDDEQILCSFFSETLRAHGYEVTALADPVAALDLFDSNPEAFDLVLTDQTMPGLTGRDLLSRIHARHPDLPVIICTGYSEFLDERQARALGAAAFLTKPVSIDQLLTTIAQCSAQASGARARPATP